MTTLDDWTNDIHIGDAEATLADMPADAVHMCMTSPPYFGLRDYGEDGQIGLEESLDAYIDELVAVFEEVRRVLRPDGVAWLNLGDSYGPDKQKQLVPHRVAIALQDAGWVVRNDVTWVKPNPMPSSVKDRLNTTTEQVFMLAPNPDYWFDLDAIREPYNETTEDRYQYEPPKGEAHDDYADATPISGGDGTVSLHESGKNPGDVFEVTTKPFPEAHFAVYPPELVEKPLKATCPPEVCAGCGSPYERETRDESGFTEGVCNACGESRSKHKQGTKNSESRSAMSGETRACSKNVFEEWSPTCDCDTDATEPGVALDPFAGAGTTALVAKDHGRRFVGIDLNPEYVAMAQKRLGLDVHDPSLVREEAEAGLDDFA